MRQLITLCILVMPLFGWSQNLIIEVEDFAFLEGDWTGTLEYLDYQDDSTRVKLPTEATFSLSGNAVKYQFIYTEANGDEEKEKGKMKIAGDGGTLEFSKVDYQLLSRQANEEAGQFNLILEGSGTDDNRPATIKQVFMLNGGRLILSKDVVYEENGEELNRNRYFFQKKSE